jgi:DNA-binding Lrp family transcriptional regulator
MATYARKRPLRTIAEELGISIHKLKRMLRVVKKDGIDGL